MGYHHGYEVRISSSSPTISYLNLADELTIARVNVPKCSDARLPFSGLIDNQLAFATVAAGAARCSELHVLTLRSVTGG
jgi:hypothetical protein